MEVSESAKYQELFHAVGISFLSVVFESLGLAGGKFLYHFDKLLVRRVDEIGTSVALLKKLLVPNTLSDAAAKRGSSRQHQNGNAIYGTIRPNSSR